MFEDVEIIKKPSSASLTAPCKAALIKFGKKDARAFLKLTFQPTAISEREFGAGDRFRLQVGRDEKHGVIRIVRDQAGSAELTARKVMGGAILLQINLGHRPELVDRPEPAQAVEFSFISTEIIEVTLPRWALETSPRNIELRQKQQAGQEAAAKEDARLAAERRERADRQAGLIR